MQIILPDASRHDAPADATPRSFAANAIGEGLAKAAIGARVNRPGEESILIDADRPIADALGVQDDASGGEVVELGIVTAPKTDKKGRSKFRDEQHEKDALYLLRHSTAHVMAEAIQRIWSGAQLAYGPPLDTGFYYDIALDTPISSDDFEKIEAEMRKIVEEDRPFTRYDLAPEAGRQKLDAEGNKYKLDNADRALTAGAQTLSFYVTGDTQDGAGEAHGNAGKPTASRRGLRGTGKTSAKARTSTAPRASARSRSPLSPRRTGTATSSPTASSASTARPSSRRPTSTTTSKSSSRRGSGITASSGGSSGCSRSTMPWDRG